jgi:hypothetical protein
MDERLAETFARILAGWLDTAAMFHRNQEFYQGIVRDIGNVFGVAARTADDGSVQDDVLALRVPELVKALHDSVLPAAKRAVGHWNEFGVHHGFSESIDQLERSMSDLGQAATGGAA